MDVILRLNKLESSSKDVLCQVNWSNDSAEDENEENFQTGGQTAAQVS